MFEDSAETLDTTDNPVESVDSRLQYKMPYGEFLIRRTTSKILSHVRYNIEQHRENYFQEQLLLYFPWREEPTDNSIENTHEHQYIC